MPHPAIRVYNTNASPVRCGMRPQSDSFASKVVPFVPQVLSGLVLLALVLHQTRGRSREVATAAVLVGLGLALVLLVGSVRAKRRHVNK
jgi:hypothetical protein